MADIHDKIFLGIEKEPIAGPESIAIADSIETLIKGKSDYLGNDLKNIAALIKDDNYYVIFDTAIIKGKQQLFKGKIIRVTNNELLVFIGHAIKGLSGRQYFLTTENFSQLLKISDEGGIYLFST